MGTTLLDIAEAVGVSRTTVSNAFNRPDQLSATLRQEILDTAEAMGYAGPNPLARKLRTGRSEAIGVLFDEVLPYAFNDPAAAAFLEGVAQGCEEAEIGLVLLPRVEPARAQQLVREAAVDGFIIYAVADGSPLIDCAAERRLSVVLVDQEAEGDVRSVNTDDRQGAYEAAMHLLDGGHRRLGILGLELDPLYRYGPVSPALRRRAAYATTRERLAGYEAACAAYGIDPARLPMEACPNREAAGRQAALHLLGRGEGPTGLLCMSDRLAVGALSATQHLGLAVPGDVAIVGFDDIPVAAHIDPPLTTVRQPVVQKGLAAARLLLDDDPDPMQIQLPTRLIVRASA